MKTKDLKPYKYQILSSFVANKGTAVERKEYDTKEKAIEEAISRLHERSDTRHSYYIAEIVSEVKKVQPEIEVEIKDYED